MPDNASDYGVNYGLTGADRITSGRKLRAQQRQTEAMAKQARQTMRQLRRDPEAYALSTAIATHRALDPDHPQYAETVQQLSEAVAANPGTRPDVAVVLADSGLDPNTEAGAKLAQAQAVSEQQQAARDFAQARQAQQMYESELAQQEAEANTGPMGFVKAFSQTAFTALDLPAQFINNTLRQTINTDDSMADPFLSFVTALARPETWQNTDFGTLVGGAGEFYTSGGRPTDAFSGKPGGTLDSSHLDMGDSFLPEEDSPVKQLKLEWDRRMMGTAGRNMKTVEVTNPDGTKSMKEIDVSPASPGQWVASDVFHVQEGTAPYSIMSGLVDAGTYLLDPTMYLTAGGVTKAFRGAENATIRRAFGIEKAGVAADRPRAANIGKAVLEADEATAGVKAATEAADAASAEVAALDEALAAEIENSRLLVAEDAAALGAHQQTANGEHAVKLLTPETAEAEALRGQESLLRQAALVADDAARKARAGHRQAAKARHEADTQRYSHNGNEPPADPPVVAQVADDGQVILRHASGAWWHPEGLTLQQADELAADLSKMPGYAHDVPFEQVEPWGKVQARMADSAARLADDAEPVSKIPGWSADPGVEARIANLHTLREKAVAEADRLAARRAEVEDMARLKSRDLAQHLGKDAPAAGDELEFLRRIIGLQDGTGRLDVDRTMAFLTNSSSRYVRKLFRAFARLDDEADIYNLTRGKLPVELVHELAGAKTEDTVAAAFAKAIARPGFLSNRLGKMRGVRVAAQVRHGRDIGELMSLYGKTFGEPGLKAVTWGKQARHGAVPWTYARDLNDADDMVTYAHDLVTNVLGLNRPMSRHKGMGMADKAREGTRKHLKAGETVSETVDVAAAYAVRDEWTRKMIRARNVMERREVYYKMLDDLTGRAADIMGLDPRLRAEMMRHLKASKMAAQDASKHNAEQRALQRASGDEVDPRIIALESHMENTVSPPNFDELRRAMHTAKEIQAIADKTGEPLSAAASDAISNVFESYWRTSVIAFRGGYIVRNMFDIWARMGLKGHPTPVTSLGTVLGIAGSHMVKPGTPTGRALEKMNRLVAKSTAGRARGIHDVYGKTLEDLADDPELAALLQEELSDGLHRLASTRLMSQTDTGLANKRVGSRYIPAGWTEVFPDDARFFEGWGNEIGAMRGAPLARLVLAVESARGKPPGFLYPFLKGKNGDLRGALVEFLAKDPKGRAVIEHARESSRPLRDLIGDPDKDGGEKLYHYLFGDDDASLRAKWQRVTLGWDDELVDMARKPQSKDEAVAAKEQASYGWKVRSAAQRLEYIDDAGKEIKQLPVQAAAVEIHVDSPLGGFGRRIRSMVDWFFARSGQTEHATGYVPEYHFAYWDHTAEMVRALSPADAQKLVETAKGTLSGLQLPNSWASRTLRQLKRNARKAEGTGLFTLDDLHKSADKVAATEVKELFYNALKRNQFAHSIRLLSPFAQPWMNTLTTWGRLAYENPGRVYAAGVIYSAGTGRDSNWLWDDPESPNDSFFYRDPGTGQMMLGVPLLGKGIALLGSMVTGMKGLGPIDSSLVSGNMSLQSMNIAFQNELLPGAGPMLSIPASFLEDVDWYRSHVPDAVKRMIQPYVRTNPDSDVNVMNAMIPAWLQGLGGAIGVIPSDKATKYLQPAVSVLMQKNPDGRYWSYGPGGEMAMSTAQQDALMRDAETLASGLLFGRSLLQNVSPGAPLPEALYRADDGRLLATTALTQEYYGEYRSRGDKGEALLAMADKYGVGALFSLMPTRRSSLPPTGQAWDFLKEDPETAEKYASVLPVFAPGGGYAARYDRWQRRMESNPQLSTDEMAAGMNSLLKAARLAELDRKYTANPPQISDEEYEAQTAYVREAYEGLTGNTDEYADDVLRDDVVKAAADPVLAARFPSVAKFVNEYAWYRQYALDHNANETLGGDGDAQWRAWLRTKASRLLAAHPEARVAWTRVFQSEVRD